MAVADKRMATPTLLMKKLKCNQQGKEEEGKMNMDHQNILKIAMKTNRTRKAKETKVRGIRKDKEVISNPTRKKTMSRGEKKMITGRRATSRLEETRNAATKQQ